MKSLKNAGRMLQKIINDNETRIIIIVIIVLLLFLPMHKQIEEKLTTTMKEFHQALVKKNTVSINQQTDKALSYGHSNGWVETKTDMIKDLETGYINYHSYKEDSLNIIDEWYYGECKICGRYQCDIEWKYNNFHLKVLEVWVKKGKRWLLFARQAVR